MFEFYNFGRAPQNAGELSVSHMKMKKEDEFYLKVAHALSGCQLVEQELKLYITEALELVTRCINGRMTFEMKGDDYADASLERLIQTFKKLTDNKELVKDLNKFKDERNFLSHRGITHCLSYYEEELSHSTVEEIMPRLAAIESEADRLRMAIHVEANKITVQLDFGEF